MSPPNQNLPTADYRLALARLQTDRQKRTKEPAVVVDTSRPLQPTAPALALESLSYPSTHLADDSG